MLLVGAGLTTGDQAGEARGCAQVKVRLEARPGAPRRGADTESDADLIISRDAAKVGDRLPRAAALDDPGGPASV